MRSLFRDADPLLLWVVAISLVGLVAIAWWEHRDRVAHDIAPAWRALALGLVIGVIGILTLTPRFGEPREWLLIPFQSIIEALTGEGRLRAALVESIQNIILFIPFGMALRWRFTRLSVARVTLVAVVFSLAIEVVQGVSATGRVANVTDVIMNGLGGLVGAVLASQLGLARSAEG